MIAASSWKLSWPRAEEHHSEAVSYSTGSCLLFSHFGIDNKQTPAMQMWLVGTEGKRLLRAVFNAEVNLMQKRDQFREQRFLYQSNLKLPCYSLFILLSPKNPPFLIMNSFDKKTARFLISSAPTQSPSKNWRNDRSEQEDQQQISPAPMQSVPPHNQRHKLWYHSCPIDSSATSDFTSTGSSHAHMFWFRYQFGLLFLLFLECSVVVKECISL